MKSLSSSANRCPQDLVNLTLLNIKTKMVKIKVMPTLKAKITEEQKTWLEKKAKKEGVYEAVIVRQVLDKAMLNKNV